MAGGIEPSSRPYSRHPGEPAKPSSPPKNRGANIKEEKIQKNTQDNPKQRRLNPKLATWRGTRLPSPAPHAGPWGAPPTPVPA